MLLNGRHWTRSEILKRVGSPDQLGSVTSFEYSEGKARGVRALRVQTAAGFSFCVSPDRGMDIVEATYQGRSLCYISPVGVVHPSYFDSREMGWLKTFSGGLLTTCGLANVGSACEDNDEKLGLHGAHSNTPAESVHWHQDWVNDDLISTIHGTVREAQTLGPNLVLNRTLRTSLSGRTFELHDVVSNEGFEASPLMILYHMNFGFPFLTERSRIYCDSIHIDSRTEFSRLTQDDWKRFNEPVAAINERVYYHTMRADDDGNVRVVLVSDEFHPDFGIELIYSKSTLPEFVEWKMNRASTYVLGIEPSNCRVDGRKVERESGRLQVLEPAEQREFNISLRVLDGAAEVADALHFLN